ncbi:hypothetical protein DEFDS_P260 (plasmid) [Deferribacter desulfuricans SSM1]|uniref:Uncharacterized protein n=1 Tax=Deferribacter desulfuricans (strain DSM 14783 / JCM 11476 / NBRC 101012 / SSM1) TaxID=639282 RepID=D3PF88_DEFDS|nr:hypothetical protein [Deferribacter desulfuricans]BAI81880.1 hypothetical protein DEFDS_P260 [Deferribacter desulfuricans SSM1]
MKKILIVILSIFTISTTVLAKVNNPLIENKKLQQIIKLLPDNQEIIVKDDVLTYYYKVYKTDKYITINKIYIESVKNYKIKIKKYYNYYVYDQVIFIYDNNFKLLKTFWNADFDKLMDYFNRNGKLIRMYKMHVFNIDSTLYKILPILIDVEDDKSFYKYQVYMYNNKIQNWVYLYDFME